MSKTEVRLCSFYASNPSRGVVGCFTRLGQAPRGASDAPHGVTPGRPVPPGPAFCSPNRSRALTSPGRRRSNSSPSARKSCLQHEFRRLFSGLGAGGEPWAVLSQRGHVALPPRPGGRNPPCPAPRGRGGAAGLWAPPQPHLGVPPAGVWLPALQQHADGAFCFHSSHFVS